MACGVDYKSANKPNDGYLTWETEEQEGEPLP